MGLFCFICGYVISFIFISFKYFVILSNTKDVPQNLIDATDKIPSFNIIPLYGLNCYSIIKHETLVLSRRALDALEQKILEFKHKTGSKNLKYRYSDYKEIILAESEHEEDLIYPPSV